MANIGFVGLGNMGLPMAVNLMKAGHMVTGFDMQPKALEAFDACGGQSVHSLEQLVDFQDVVITMLQTGDQVQQVCLDEHGVFSMMQPGSLYVDCSTIDVVTARVIHQAAEAVGILMADAPVSGGVAGAQAASLSFMVGCTEPVFSKVSPILSDMGSKIIHTGAAGSGQAAKVCNNMVLGVSMIAVSEAFVLAQGLGLSPEKLLEVISNASGQCWVTDKYLPVPDLMENVPANNDYRPGFSAAMMLKDLRLSQQAAADHDLHLSVAAQATAMYQTFNEAGNGDLDFSAIIKAVN